MSLAGEIIVDCAEGFFHVPILQPIFFIMSMSVWHWHILLRPPFLPLTILIFQEFGTLDGLDKKRRKVCMSPLDRSTIPPWWHLPRIRRRSRHTDELAAIESDSDAQSDSDTLTDLYDPPSAYELGNRLHPVDVPIPTYPRRSRSERRGSGSAQWRPPTPPGYREHADGLWEDMRAHYAAEAERRRNRFCTLKKLKTQVRWSGLKESLNSGVREIVQTRSSWKRGRQQRLEDEEARARSREIEELGQDLVLTERSHEYLRFWVPVEVHRTDLSRLRRHLSA